MFTMSVKKVQTWCSREDGAVTVDMVVLTAGAIALAIGAVSMFNPNSYNGLGLWIEVISIVLEYATFDQPL